MSQQTVVLIAVLVVVLGIAAIVGWWLSRRRKSARLRQRFGPEYDRALDERGDQRAAEAELLAREEKRNKLDIVELTAEARQEHADTWRRVQTEFVDSPQEAVGRAERLVTRVMRERGYPIDEFEQRAADISVDHPDVVENYRHAHAVYLSQQQGDITTEQARQAFVHYRALFDRLLGSDSDHRADTHRAHDRRQTHDHA
ncbi:hypothetical protein [Mycobacterium sp. NAZ190054]|uniref:hypothetical protein n=1 Tax=Mycobacterium sp. NAZ190054 TaxID=1747766 RepID=UPI00079AF826|nr:hypothetical protein [Mycobacterium sp. NAZ190054]KWX68214.1 hypothetical protein ASJ79_03390 [Mycobacterium sp. NAZ190054]